MASKVSHKIILLTLHLFLYPLVRLIWVKQVVGIKNIPSKGGVLLAFNHQSYFDFIGFMAITPRPVHYLAAEKFYTKETHWLWSPIMQATGQVRVNRTSSDKREMYSAVKKILNNGEVLGIFPEGTRVLSNTTMQRGFSGVVDFSISNNVPIVPIGIRGAYEIMNRNEKIPKFKKILEFHIGEPISLEEYRGHILSDKDRQELTDSVMSQIGVLSRKEYLYGK